MARPISDLKSHLALGGARPSLFEVSITGVPGLANIDGSVGANLADLRFFCKAASLPPENIGVVEVPYQGRKVKYAGNRTFPEWQITVINDEDFTIKAAFEAWHQALNLHQANVRGNGATAAPASYKAEARVKQLSKDGSTLRAYNFQGLWPSEVAAITLDWGTVDAIEEFTVTFQYDLWENDGILE